MQLQSKLKTAVQISEGFMRMVEVAWPRLRLKGQEYSQVTSDSGYFTFDYLITPTNFKQASHQLMDSLIQDLEKGFNCSLLCFGSLSRQSATKFMFHRLQQLTDSRVKLEFYSIQFYSDKLIDARLNKPVQFSKKGGFSGYKKSCVSAISEAEQLLRQEVLNKSNTHLNLGFELQIDRMQDRTSTYSRLSFLLLELNQTEYQGISLRPEQDQFIKLVETDSFPSASAQFALGKMMKRCYLAANTKVMALLFADAQTAGQQMLAQLRLLSSLKQFKYKARMNLRISQQQLDQLEGINLQQHSALQIKLNIEKARGIQMANQVQTLKLANRQLQTLIAEKQAEHFSAKHQSQKSKQTTQQLLRKVAYLQIFKAEIEVKAEEFKPTLSAQNSTKIKSLELAVSELQQQLKQMRIRLEQSQTTKSMLLKRIDTLTSFAMGQQINFLKQQINQLTKQNEQLRITVKKITSFQEQKGEFDRAKAKLFGDLKDRILKVLQLQQSLDSQREQRVFLQSIVKKDKLTQKLYNSQKKIQELNQKFLSLKAKQCLWKNENQFQRHRQALKDQRIKQLQLKLSGARDQCQSLRKKNIELMKEQASLRRMKNKEQAGRVQFVKMIEH